MSRLNMSSRAIESSFSYLALAMSASEFRSDIEGHSVAATALTDLGVSTLLVTFLGIRKSQRSP